MDKHCKILVSACLLGNPVRYDGQAKPLGHALLNQWYREGRVVQICPEMLGGFVTPRPPAEIAGGDDGRTVLDGNAQVNETTGADATSQFIEGANRALRIAVDQGCSFALLTDGSPSCGSQFIYDGRFVGHRHAGEGVTTALFRRNGINVFAPDQIEQLAAAVEAFEC